MRLRLAFEENSEIMAGFREQRDFDPAFHTYIDKLGIAYPELEGC